MILVIGGLYAGKKDWVIENIGFSKEDFSSSIESNKPVLYDLQNLDINESQIDLLLKKKVIICNETGCGIVPINKEERIKRENTGRLLIFLAKNAENVFRVYCGIGQRIK
jgi:adenosylcobinamide kinase/adenosylcobinamide-phosphate guanylyltransferase